MAATVIVCLIILALLLFILYVVPIPTSATNSLNGTVFWVMLVCIVVGGVIFNLPGPNDLMEFCLEKMGVTVNAPLGDIPVPVKGNISREGAGIKYTGAIPQGVRLAVRVEGQQPIFAEKDEIVEVTTTPSEIEVYFVRSLDKVSGQSVFFTAK